MTKYPLFLWLFLAAHISLAQTFFEYDQAGNRIKRTFTPVPDLVSLLQVSPTTIYGTTSLTARLRVAEINGVATSGLITVKLPKQTNVTFMFSPATTSVANTPVQNANWSFTNSDPNYYVFTSTTPVAGGDLSTIGLEGMMFPGSTGGLLSISMVILGGSGSEARINNNTAAAKIDYFPN